MPEMLENLSLQGGKNYAPLKPLVDLRDRRKDPKSNYLTDMVRERYTHYMSVDKDVWQDLITVGHLTSLFIQGKQNLKWNKLTNSFYTVPVTKQANEKMRVTPIMRFYTTNSESRYMSSNPQIEVTAAREDDKCNQAAKGAKAIVDHYSEKLYTNGFNSSEALHLMSFGTQINQVRWNSSKQGWQGIRKIFEEREIPISAGVGQCLDCGMVGTGTEFLQRSERFASCPECESFNAYAEPPTTQIFNVETGREKVNLGDLEINPLEFPACRWDLRRKAEESSWFIYDQMISVGAVQRILGDVSIPDDKRGENEFGLDVVESLARAGLAINGKSSVSDDQIRSALYRERAKLTEFYLSAEDMTGMKTSPAGEETISGEKLPGGTSYADIYPEGASFVGLSGMSLLLGVYPKASHKDELTTGTWHRRQFSGAGQGNSDSVEINKRYNETDSQAFLAMKHQATPATVYAAGSIEKEYRQYLGNPDVAIPINMDAFEGARSINDIITAPRVGMIDAGLIQYYAQNLQNMMQLTMHVTSFSAGLPGVSNKTATGAQIGDSNANALFTPMLGVKVDVRVRAAEIFVRLYLENVPVKQFFPLASKFGAQQGVWLSGADLDKDLIFASVKNSELPKSQYSVRDDLDRFLMVSGGLQGVAMAQAQSPKLFNELCRKYNIEFEIDNFDEAEQISRQRFEEAKKVLKTFNQIESAVSQVVAGLKHVGESSSPELEAGAAQFMGRNDALQLPPEAQSPQEESGEPMQESPAAEAAEPMSPQGSAPEAMPSQPAQPVQDSMATAQPMPQVSPVRAKAQEVCRAIQNPVSPYEDNHTDKAAWFSGFLDTDEGRNLDSQMREIVYEFIDEHFQAGGARAAQISQMAGKVALAGQMPGQIADAQKQQFLAESDPHNQKQLNA